MSRHGDTSGALDGEYAAEAAEARRLGRSVSEELLAELIGINRQILDEQRRTNALLAGFAQRRAAAPPANAPAQGRAQSSAGGRVAPDRDLDGPNGDPTIRKVHKNWNGPDFTGFKLSECSPEFLDDYADFKDWQADRPREGADPKYAKYDRLDSARARGWAARVRQGGVQAAAPRAPQEDELIP